MRGACDHSAPFVSDAEQGSDSQLARAQRRRGPRRRRGNLRVSLSLPHRWVQTVEPEVATSCGGAGHGDTAALRDDEPTSFGEEAVGARAHRLQGARAVLLLR
jgi:hypothetical protein